MSNSRQGNRSIESLLQFTDSNRVDILFENLCAMVRSDRTLSHQPCCCYNFDNLILNWSSFRKPRIQDTLHHSCNPLYTKCWDLLLIFHFSHLPQTKTYTLTHTVSKTFHLDHTPNSGQFNHTKPNRHHDYSKQPHSSIQLY